LNGFLEGKYEMVLKETEDCGCTLLEAERTLLGTDHAELGGHILAEWNFPESLAKAVRYHHQPLEAAPYEFLASSIHIADLIAHLAGHSPGHQAFAVHAGSAPAELLGISAKDIEMLVLETESALAETKLFNQTAA